MQSSLREGLKWKARSAARTCNEKPDPSAAKGHAPIDNNLIPEKKLTMPPILFL